MLWKWTGQGLEFKVQQQYSQRVSFRDQKMKFVQSSPLCTIHVKDQNASRNTRDHVTSAHFDTDLSSSGAILLELTVMLNMR